MAWFFQPTSPIYVRPVALRNTLWGELVRTELRFIWYLRRTIDRAGAGLIFRQFISNNPYRDVSLLTWCVAGLGWYEYGMKMLWVLLPNLVACGVLRAVFAAPRPFEYDRQLRPFADRHLACYGFPSIESHMAVVVFGYVAHRLGTSSNPHHRQPHGWNSWQVGTAVAAWFIGLTRVYAGSRFSHQVLLSWVTGALSLWLYVEMLETLVPDWGEGGSLQDRHLRLALLAPWVLALMAYVGLAIEDNSSNIWRVPNSEFTRVMTHIMDIGAAAEQRERSGVTDNSRRSAGQQDDDEDDNNNEGDAMLGSGARRRSRRGRGGGGSSEQPQTRGSGSGGQEEEQGDVTRQERRRRRLASRHDGFYWLQHSMRRKGLERQALREHWGREEEEKEQSSGDLTFASPAAQPSGGGGGGGAFGEEGDDEAYSQSNAGL